MSIIIPTLPMPWNVDHHCLKAGAMLWPRTTNTRAVAKPATKLLVLVRSEGRYRKPAPAECSGIMKTSYLPGGRPPLRVVFGFAP